MGIRSYDNICKLVSCLCWPKTVYINEKKMED